MGITIDFFMTKNKDKKLNNKLTPKQELFCQLMVNSVDLFGNATKSYLCAYGMDESNINTASTNASRMLRNAKVSDRVNQLLDELIDEKIVDRELMYVILQRKDLSAKVSAIREYNKLRGRVSDKNKLEGEFVFRWDDAGMIPPKSKE